MVTECCCVWRRELVFMGWYSLVFLCCVEGVEATLVFYNYKFQNSFPRLLRCVLRFGGFSCVCWGYSDSNCRARDACWCLGPVGLWRCGVDGARWARKYYGGWGHTVGNAEGRAVLQGWRCHTVCGATPTMWGLWGPAPLSPQVSLISIGICVTGLLAFAHLPKKIWTPYAF